MLNLFRTSKSKKRKESPNESAEAPQHPDNVNESEIKDEPYRPLCESDSDSTNVLNNRKRKARKTSTARTNTEQAMMEHVISKDFIHNKFHSDKSLNVVLSSEADIGAEANVAAINQDDKASSSKGNGSTQLADLKLQGYENGEENKEAIKKPKNFLRKFGSLMRGRSQSSRIDINQLFPKEPDAPQNLIELRETQLIERTDESEIQPYADLNVTNACDASKMVILPAIVGNSHEEAQVHSEEKANDDYRKPLAAETTEDSLLSLQDDMSLNDSPMTGSHINIRDEVCYERLHDESEPDTIYQEDTMENSLLGSESSSESTLSLSDVILNEKMTTMPGVRVIKPPGSVSSTETVITHLTYTAGNEDAIVDNQDEQEDKSDHFAKDFNDVPMRPLNIALYKEAELQSESNIKPNSQAKEEKKALKEQYDIQNKFLKDTEHTYQLDIENVLENSCVVHTNYVEMLRKNESLNLQLHLAEDKIDELKAELQKMKVDKQAMDQDHKLTLQAEENGSFIEQNYEDLLKGVVNKCEENIVLKQPDIIKTRECMDRMEKIQKELRDTLAKTMSKHKNLIKAVEAQINTYEQKLQNTNNELQDAESELKSKQNNDLAQAIEKAKEDAARIWEKKHNEEMNALSNELEKKLQKDIEDAKEKLKLDCHKRVQTLEAIQAEKENEMKKQIQKLEEERIESAKTFLMIQEQYENEKTQAQIALESANQQYHDYLHLEEMRYNALQKKLIEEHQLKKDTLILRHNEELAKLTESKATEIAQLNIWHKAALEKLSVDIKKASENRAKTEQVADLMKMLKIREDEIERLEETHKKDLVDMKSLQERCKRLENDLVDLTQKLCDMYEQYTQNPVAEVDIKREDNERTYEVINEDTPPLDKSTSQHII